ncbi:MAG TPA: Crp/Fnr family transcriptional regulator [Steroidobacteraceae bacterium]|nr:Crp/Fnr family transcriptional regulator [Steroidobacteraceae bacterium]
MNAPQCTAPTNRLLSVLSDRSRNRFLESCIHVELRFGEVLCNPGERVRHVYFPTDSFISLITHLDDGARLEVGIVGDEGMLGTSLVLGVAMAPQYALVQGAGSALRMTTAVFQGHCRRSAVLRQHLDRYVYVLMSQVAQTAACTSFHTVDARLARWLMTTVDRAHSSRFHLTHEFLAYMLGVRRVGITKAAGSLQTRGLISYSRGEINVHDAAALERAACSCYRQARNLYEKILGAPPGRAPGIDRAQC